MSKIKIFSFIILSASFLLPALATSTKVYVRSDKEGTLVFSDTPSPGAEEVNITPNNAVSSAIDTSVLDVRPKIIEEKYHVEIIQPKNKATIRNNNGSIHIAGQIKPTFKQGLSIQLYLDGKPHTKPQKNAIFSLQNIERGEHQIKMDIINDKGKIIASSESITFYMHRAIVNNAG